jgi:hypothetical protein
MLIEFKKMKTKIKFPGIYHLIYRDGYESIIYFKSRHSFEYFILAESVKGCGQSWIGSNTKIARITREDLPLYVGWPFVSRHLTDLIV